MSVLSSFSPEEADLIISLPYRVGMYVSYSEDEDGRLDDTLEMKALEDALKKSVNKEVREDSVKEFISVTLENKNKWEAWSQGVFNIEPLCEKAVILLKSRLGINEVKDYVDLCLEVAGDVARAYGEFGENDQEHDYNQGRVCKTMTEKLGLIDKIIEKIFVIMPGIKGQEVQHPMNISATEDCAIERIAEVMKEALRAG